MNTHTRMHVQTHTHIESLSGILCKRQIYTRTAHAETATYTHSGILLLNRLPSYCHFVITASQYDCITPHVQKMYSTNKPNLFLNEPLLMGTACTLHASPLSGKMTYLSCPFTPSSSSSISRCSVQGQTLVRRRTSPLGWTWCEGEGRGGNDAEVQYACVRGCTQLCVVCGVSCR